MSPRTEFPPVRACLFDMDGLLIDTEDIYTICMNTILREYGKPDMPWSVKAQLQGRPGYAANKIFHDWAKLPITEDEFYEKLRGVQKTHFPSAKPLPGVEELLKNLSETTNPKVHIAVATSSHNYTYKLKTDHLQDFFSVFPKGLIVLGDDTRIPIGKGKPSPEIYLLALDCVNQNILKEGKEPPITPEECLVFEDSVPGIEAGRRAGMRVVWVPHTALMAEFAGKEKEVLAGTTPWYSDDPNGKASLGGKPGTIDDGLGKQLKTLENFPYSDYGIKVGIENQ